MDKKRILVVDDITSNIQTIVSLLEETGKPYNLYSAINGKIALKIAEIKLPDLIITDWDMPEMNGLELITQLHQEPKLRQTPCIMVTGMHTLSEDLKVALDTGAVDFVRKPINKLELWARVEATLKLHDAYQTISEQKERELSTQTLQLHQKNQLLSEVQEKVEKAMGGLEVSQRGELKEVLKLLKSNISIDNQWDNFKLHFEGVHPDFFRKLEHDFPHLTQNDHKLCAYIRIGLNSGEIASLMNITTASLRITRTRLKKKMSLEPETDLIDFILGKI